MMTTPAALLLDVAALIEREGHWRGGFPRSGHCVVTGIQAQADMVNGPKAASLVYAWLADHSTLSLTEWNDAHSRVHVVGTLRRIAREAATERADTPASASDNGGSQEVPNGS